MHCYLIDYLTRANTEYIWQSFLQRTEIQDMYTFRGKDIIKIINMFELKNKNIFLNEKEKHYEHDFCEITHASLLI